MHIERIYLPETRYDELRDAFVKRAANLSIGASYDFGPEIGSLVSPDHRDRVASHVEDAVAKGATVLTGGRARPDLGPAFFEPTVLEGVTKDMLAGSTRDVRTRRRALPLPHRRRGDQARQRHRLRPQRVGLER